MLFNSRLYKKALLLSYFTIGYNIIEFILSIFAGIVSNSIALIGFGLDSLVESLSAGIMVWRFSKKNEMTEEELERIEHKAERLVGFTFLILAAYIVYESINKLVTSEIPQTSVLGIFVAVASIIVMPVLFFMKLRTGKALNSRSLIADSKETLACSFLSVALLLGLGANYLLGFWQADSIVGIVIALFLIREGIEILRGGEEN